MFACLIVVLAVLGAMATQINDEDHHQKTDFAKIIAEVNTVSLQLPFITHTFTHSHTHFHIVTRVNHTNFIFSLLSHF